MHADVKHRSSHITPDNKAWIVRRKCRDSISTLNRLSTEFTRKILFWITHPMEARQTKNSIFLVYTMGKVASMSVFHTISKRLPHVKTFAMHYMCQENLSRQELILKDSIYRKMHTDHALKIWRCIDQNPGREKKIITVVRDPLAQVISDVFQHLSYHRLDELKYLSIDNRQVNFNYPEEWTDQELLPFSGIDILKENFDPEMGYAIYQKGQYSLLVLRYEDLPGVFPAAMAQFTGIKSWRLADRNRSKDKDYAVSYARFKSELKVSPDVIQYVYSSDFVRHFYTTGEIERFRERWG
jgi:hypothetical protein